MALQKLTSTQELTQLLEGNKTFLLLKNSITCPISHEAYKQFEKLANELEDEKMYYLNVQEARDLSSEIAEAFAIKHESPQALLFKNGKVTWHTSHWKITYKALKELLA